MNKNSVICNFIAEHPDDWENLLEKEYDIRIKTEGNYAIFNYEIASNFYDPVVQEARGIIIDYVNLEVVCWPFRKFGNYNEGYADSIDWSSARVLEKVDGSITKLWYDKYAERWQFSTNGVIRAENANLSNKPDLFYGDIIRKADNYKDIPFETLNRDYTYIFELVSPETRIVIEYKNTSLYHLGTRNNLTGEEYEIDIGIKKPASYPLNSLDNCINAAIALNKSVIAEDEVEKEGFVVVDGNWHRVKIKSPDYIMMHHVSMMRMVTKKECVHILLHERDKLDLIYKKCPDIIPTFKYYDYKIAELLYSADRIASLSRRLYEEYGKDRKAVAGVILKHRLSMVGFTCLTSEQNGRDVLLQMTIEQFCKYVPDYQPEDFSQLFKNG